MFTLYRRRHSQSIGTTSSRWGMERSVIDRVTPRNQPEIAAPLKRTAAAISGALALDLLVDRTIAGLGPLGSQLRRGDVGGRHSSWVCCARSFGHGTPAPEHLAADPAGRRARSRRVRAEDDPRRFSSGGAAVRDGPGPAARSGATGGECHPSGARLPVPWLPSWIRPCGRACFVTALLGVDVSSGEETQA